MRLMKSHQADYIRSNRYGVRYPDAESEETTRVIVDRPTGELDRMHALCLLAWVSVLLQIDLQEFIEAREIVDDYVNRG